MKHNFLALKFGMFIHYNMATYERVQWVSGYPAPSTFDPGGVVDTDAWADAAVAAGMTYGVLTAKHVGGFCLWDSETTRYGVMHPDCSYQQDLVAQFVKSFTSRGLKAGLYYCWRNPGFDAGENAGMYKVLPPECDPATHSPDEQVDFQKKQITELLARYPEVFYIWNDALDPDIMPADDAARFIRGVRPDVIASGNWWSWSRKGEPYLDIAVTETRHFREGNQHPGETCWKLETGGWFWDDTPPREPGDVVADAKTANARNANFLLNVGPDKSGRIADASKAALAEIGRLWTPGA